MTKKICPDPNPYDKYTNAALKEVTLYQISSKKKRNIDENRPRNSYWTVDGDDTLEWVNIKYAYTCLHQFFYFRPHRPFEIHKLDLTPVLIERLERLEFEEINEIMVEVVRRMLEAVDSFYYHTSGIHSNIIWGFV